MGDFTTNFPGNQNFLGNQNSLGNSSLDPNNLSFAIGNLSNFPSNSTLSSSLPTVLPVVSTKLNRENYGFWRS